MTLHLRRITSSKLYLPELDGLRFLAIMPVLELHISTFVRRRLPMNLHDGSIDLQHLTTPFTRFGVPLFYCISGFILSLPFAREALGRGTALPLSEFYRRRLTRLEPPYLVSLTVFFLVHLYANGVPFAEAFPHYLASVFYLHNVIYGTWSTINGVAWTLEIEFQFYLLAPFVVRGFFSLRSARARIAALSACMLVFGLVEAYGSDWLAQVHLDKTLLTKAHYFLGGMLLCDLYLRRGQSFGEVTFRWDCLAALGLLATAPRFLFQGPYWLGYSAFLLGILLMFVGAFRGRLLRPFFQSTPVSIIGGMCYSIYLLHYPLIHFLGKFFPMPIFTERLPWLNIYAYQAIYGPIVLIVSCAYYVLIERPCMDPAWPRKLVNWFGLGARTARA